MKNSKQNETLMHSMHHEYESNTFKELLKKVPFLFNFFKSMYIFMLHLISKNRWKKVVTKSEVKLNLGAGPTKGTNGWTNVESKLKFPE